MAEKHGVKFKSSRGSDLYFTGSEFRVAKDTGIYGGDGFYVSPDSLDKFKPIPCDIIQIDGDFPYIVVDEKSYADVGVLYGKRHKLIELNCLCNFNDIDEFKWWLEEGIIIQRNDIPFMWPDLIV